MGFLEDIAKNITLKAIAEMSKDKNGKIDPYKAAGIAAGTGNFSSPKDKAMLGAILGSEGAFDDDYNTSYNKEDSHAWRDEYEFDDITSDISPYDYETEEEYKEAKYEWRQFCDYDYEHGIDPEDYETEEEYNEALNEAKYGWRDLCADGSDYGLDPEDYETEDEYNEAISEISDNDITIPVNITVNCSDNSEKINPDDYPNKRRYNTAYELARLSPYIDENDKDDLEEKRRWEFILNNADKLLAANYLTPEGDFLYAQAIKDNFKLPCALPDEDEKQEMYLYQILTKIAKRDILFSFKIWSWCLEQFFPYIQYARSYIRDKFSEELSEQVIEHICIFYIGAETYHFPDDYKTMLVNYMNDNPDFLNSVMNACEEVPDGIAVLIAVAFNEQLYTVAEHIFKSGLKQARGQWKEINELTQNVLSRCKDYKEVESIEYFRENLLPLVENIEDEMVKDEIDGWEQGIDEYITEVEKHSPKYAYTRRYAWRAKYKDVEDCPLSPENYETEETFLSKLHERKVSWRRSFFRTNNHGVNPNDYENLEDFREAVDKAILAECEELKNDKTIYTYLGVIFDDNKVYNYRTTDSTIKIGDTVIVPVGVKKSNKNATVVSVGQYTRLAAPYPVEKTKEIIGKGTIQIMDCE